MRAFFAALGLGCLTLQASIVPTFHLDNTTLKAFQDYVANFEKSVSDHSFLEASSRISPRFIMSLPALRFRAS